MSARRDPRGQVAVVRAHSWGPKVFFISRRTVAEALRSAAVVWIESEGDYSPMPIPTSVWVQQRAGQWVRA